MRVGPLDVPVLVDVGVWSVDVVNRSVSLRINYSLMRIVVTAFLPSSDVHVAFALGFSYLETLLHRYGMDYCPGD